MSRSTFKKRGRPAEDRVARRLEIFRAIAPELERDGAKALTMRHAAELAFVSTGTLYHYFPSKRALVLYGLDPEPAGLICRSFEPPAGGDHEATASAVVDLIVDTVRLMRASASAAIEAGPDVARQRLDAVVHEPIAEFGELLERHGLADAGPSRNVELVVRRSIASALLEPAFSAEELRRHFREILGLD